MRNTLKGIVAAIAPAILFICMIAMFCSWEQLTRISIASSAVWTSSLAVLVLTIHRIKENLHCYEDELDISFRRSVNMVFPVIIWTLITTEETTVGASISPLGRLIGLTGIMFWWVMGVLI